MTLALELGGKLRRSRVAKGMSLTEVARVAGVSAATLSRIENSKQTIDVALLIAIASIIDVPPSIFFHSPDGHATLEVIDDLAALSPKERATAFSEAMKRGDTDGGSRRAATEARLDALIVILDAVRREVVSLQSAGHLYKRSRAAGTSVRRRG